MPITEIQQAASGLSEGDRAALAVWLLDSLPPHACGDGLSESIAEASKRRAELDSGQVVPIPADAFWASIDRERAAWK